MSYNRLAKAYAATESHPPDDLMLALIRGLFLRHTNEMRMGDAAVVPEAVFEKRFPSLHWREPLLVKVAGNEQDWYACRFCIARHGLKAKEITHTKYAFRSASEWRAHMTSDHPR